MQLQQMTGTLGTEISGVDLADGKSETAEAIRRLAIENRVVVVRGQSLTDQTQMDFSRRLGDLINTRGLAQNSVFPELYIVKNPGKGGMPTNNWHTDATTSARPPSLTILAARVLPSSGGDTLFVDMVQAYERLSPAYRRMLRGLRVHHINRTFDPEKPFGHCHPIVRLIPETGESALFSGFPYIAETIDGWTSEESKPVLDYLFAQSIKPDAVYRHRWLPGDVVIWDNRSTMHYAVHDYGEQDRFLARTMIEGEAPIEPIYAD